MSEDRNAKINAQADVHDRLALCQCFIDSDSKGQAHREFSTFVFEGEMGC
jgi:hypothetical protein